MSLGVKDLTMSRSYKHIPVYKVGGKTKFAKRVANKKIRRSGKDNPENAYSGKSNDYRKKMNHGIFGIIDFGENQYGERNLGGT